MCVFFQWDINSKQLKTISLWRLQKRTTFIILNRDWQNSMNRHNAKDNNRKNFRKEHFYKISIKNLFLEKFQ